MVWQRLGNSPWFILGVVLLASMAAPLNQFKVPPVMTLLMDAFHQPPAQAGLLMSVFAITGLILAIPAGFIFHKLGPKITGLIALFSLILGAAMGALTDRIGILLGSRFIEGAGMSLMSVLAPALIAIWFREEERGKAMGIWAVWVPLGSTIMFLAAPFFVSFGGWSGVWWFGCIYAILVSLLFLFFVKPHPPALPSLKKAAPATSSKALTTFVFLNKDLWLISLLFCCFNFVFISFVTWAPTFLQQVHRLSLSQAALLVSALNIMALIACPLAGWISDKVGSRKAICLFPMILMTILFPLSVYISGNKFLILIILLGFAGGFVPPGVFAAAVETVSDENLSGMAMAVVQIGQNAGMLLGPLIFGLVLDSAGSWGKAFWMLAPISLVGALSAWRVRMK